MLHSKKETVVAWNLHICYTMLIIRKYLCITSRNTLTPISPSRKCAYLSRNHLDTMLVCHVMQHFKKKLLVIPLPATTLEYCHHLYDKHKTLALSWQTSTKALEHGENKSTSKSQHQTQMRSGKVTTLLSLAHKHTCTQLLHSSSALSGSQFLLISCNYISEVFSPLNFLWKNMQQNEGLLCIHK